jgi:hypothetical protein
MSPIGIPHDLRKSQMQGKAARFIDAWILKAERTGDKFLAKFIGGLKIGETKS